MTKRRAIIFDVDGTLSDPTHRLHYLPNHQKFLDACHADPAHPEVVLLFDMIYHFKMSDEVDDSYDIDIFIASGRADSHRRMTVESLRSYGIFSFMYEKLYMRKTGDYRPDTVVKKEFLEEIRKTHDVIFTVDDRQSVVDMWRSEGIPCFQVRAWDEKKKSKYEPGKLILMVGPSGAGKSTLIKELGWEKITVSSDQLRHELCGDFKCQDKNTQVFTALHAIVKARLEGGLTTVVDSTNIRTADRLALVVLVPHVPVEYVVVDRPVEDKKRDGGWRNEIPGFDLIRKHDQTFKSNLKAILAGDNRPNVIVNDMRK